MSDQHSEVAGSPGEPSDKHPPAKRLTWLVLLLTALFFLIYVLSDRYAPYTDQARVKGLIVPVTPRVSGYVTDIHVHINSRVKAGDTLFQLDKKPFLIEIARAEANLDNTIQSIEASTSSVKAAVGRLGVAKAQHERAKRNWERVQMVMKENAGALSKADKDQAETAYFQAVEQVASAQASLDREKQRLGIAGPDNPKIRAALQILEKAQLNLAFTTILAPVDGVIESFDIDTGYYASAGQPLATLISSKGFWIQANMKENNLSLMDPGDRVEMLFDIAPGKIFKGKVVSIGYGVEVDKTNKGGLPSVKSKSSWLQDPQRFPVVIRMEEDAELGKLIRLGGQLDVVVYNDDGLIINSLAALRLRIISILSYVR